MDRDDFLARIREGLDTGHRLDTGHGLSDLEPPERPGAYQPPPAPDRAAMTDLLIRELEAVGGAGHRTGFVEEARRRVIEILDERQARKVIRGDTPLLRRLDLDAELERSGVEVTVASASTDRDQLRRAAFDADAGITSADFGVAETGTLALLAAPGQGRAVSLLPPLHVAVLDARDVVYELAALFEAVTARGALPSALTFVTGPSRTGDIEQTLTVGVHGPGDLQLVVID